MDPSEMQRWTCTGSNEKNWTQEASRFQGIWEKIRVTSTICCLSVIFLNVVVVFQALHKAHEAISNHSPMGVTVSRLDVVSVSNCNKCDGCIVECCNIETDHVHCKDKNYNKNTTNADV